MKRHDKIQKLKKAVNMADLYFTDHKPFPIKPEKMRNWLLDFLTMGESFTSIP